MRPLRLTAKAACLALAVLAAAGPARAAGEREVLVYPLFPGPLPSGHPLPYRNVTPVDMRLVNAAENGSLDGVEAALAAGASVKARAMSGNLALHCAAAHGHLAIVSRLVAAGADVNALDKRGEDLLSIAVRARNPALARLALELGANPAREMSDERGTALSYAARRGEADIVRQLIAAGAPVNHADAHGRTALQEAVLFGDGGERYDDVVAQLLKAGARVDLADRQGRDPLETARARGFQNLVTTFEAVRRAPLP